jgi:hypothetical protein
VLHSPIEFTEQKLPVIDFDLLLQHLIQRGRSPQTL